MNYGDKGPQTIDAAVDSLIGTLSVDDQGTIASTPRENLVMLHFDLGLAIRNSFGLWDSESPLVRATGKANPDDASMVIIEALWVRLQQSGSGRGPE